MLDDVHYLVHFEPPIEISQDIEKLHNRISDRFENTYNSLVEGVWRSHLMLYLSPMPTEKHEDIVNAVNDVSSNINPFTITLGDFEITSTGFVFVTIDAGTQQKLIDIHEILVHTLLPYRDNQIKQKYLDRWSSFTQEEKDRINTTGLPYLYAPHLTIAKVQEKDCTPVTTLMKDASFTGTSFEATQMQVLTFHKGINHIVGTFRLGQ